MTVSEALELLLRSYRQYYNVETEKPAAPFVAEAVFHSHNEQYVLVKSAKISEAEAHEYVFFATARFLTLDDVTDLDEKAWTEGLSRVRPHYSHRSSDMVLIILAEQISPDARDYIRSIKRYKSYRFTLQGWSHYSVVALETSTGEWSCNKRGRDLRKLFRNII